MKKLFLSLAVVAMGFSFASADTVELNFVDNAYNMERQSGSSTTYEEAGAKIVTEGALTITNTSSTAPSGGVRLWSDGLRFYKEGSILISVDGGTITKISAKGKSGGNLANIVYDNAATVTNDWTGAASSVSMDCIITKSNTPLSSLTIEYSLGAGLEAADLSFPQATYTVEYPAGTFTAPELTKATDAPVTYTSSDTDVATVSATGEVTIVGPGVTKITASCEKTDKYSAGSASYTLEVVGVANSIAEMMQLAPNAKDVVKVGCPLTVTYVNGKYVYVVDAVGDATLLFNTNTYEIGDIIPGGWEATYSPYFGLPEFAGTFPAASGKAEVTYETVESVSNADLNKVLWLNKVTFEATTPNGKENFDGILSDGTSIKFRNNFLAESVEAGEYCVKVAVAIYNDELQVYPIEYTAIADEAPYDVYVIGADVNGVSWTEGDPSGKMTYVGNGIFEWTGEKLATGFKFNDGSWSGQLNIGGEYGSASLGIPYSVIEGGSNIELSDFFGYILTDAKIVFDTNNMTIVVTGTKTKVVVDWYFASSINEFTLDDSCKMSATNEEGVYELAKINIENPGMFKITTAGWGEQYGMGEAITSDHLFTTLAKVNYGGDVEFNVAKGEYSIKWDFNSSTVTFTLLRATGVEGIAADAEDAQYYNLQGVKVANPTNGIYVKVVGNKAQKVNIRK